MFRKVVLALLLAFIVEHAPWRLMALFAETFVTRPGLTRVVQTNNLYWESAALEARIIELGYSVTYVKDLTVPAGYMQVMQVYGATRKGPEHIDIRVEAALSWDARYSILAHEGGHIFQDEGYSHAEGEAFAEAVAMLVSHDGIREHARYLSQKKLALLTVIALDHERIYRAAAVLQE